MISAKLNELELLDGWYESDPTMRVKVNFPFSLGTGNRNTAVVYFELEPGHRLGTHTDSAEEILLILEGTAEVSLGDEEDRLSAGEMALVPAMVPHGLRNVSEETVRVVGFPRQRGSEYVRPADDALWSAGPLHPARRGGSGPH